MTARESWALTPDSEKVTLLDCPVGLFVSSFGHICLKTEYGNNAGRIDAYIVDSGEFFWGEHPQTIENQRKQLVTPLTCESLQPNPTPPADVAEVASFATLREANHARQIEWDKGNKISLSYRGNEMAGECGEACNVIKKLERERLGIRGSRATVDELASELADVIICADLIAMMEGIDLDAAVAAKFNATSEKVGLRTRYVPAASEHDAAVREVERLRTALEELTTACEADFIGDDDNDPDPEHRWPDDDAVGGGATPADDMAITFGMIRRARATLAQPAADGGK